MDRMRTVDEHIGEWRAYLLRQKAVQNMDIEKLEDYLRTQAKILGEAGLDEDEAFLVAVKRLGKLDSLSREFALMYSERLWHQMIVPPEGGAFSRVATREVVVAVGLAVAAAIAIKIPEIIGIHFMDDFLFYMQNLSLFVLPFLAVYFAWKRRLDRIHCIWLVLPFLVGAAVINIFPFEREGHTQMLTVIHLPIALWLAAGFAYTGGRWRVHEQRMNFVRFSGEWFIYYSLLGLGGGVFVGLTLFIFNAIGLDLEFLVEGWILPCGIAGAVLIAAWLADARQRVIGNIAPVLTLVFTPLFTVLLLAFLVTLFWTGNPIKVEREVLIGFDLLLVVVLGLMLYAISARDPNSPRSFFDVLQFILVACALLVDVIALLAISSRITGSGFTPNRTAALGLNLILLVNLSWSAVLFARFLLNRQPFILLERWQTSYAPPVCDLGVGRYCGVPHSFRISVMWASHNLSGRTLSWTHMSRFTEIQQGTVALNIL